MDILLYKRKVASACHMYIISDVASTPHSSPRRDCPHYSALPTRSHKPLMMFVRQGVILYTITGLWRSSAVLRIGYRSVGYASSDQATRSDSRAW